MHRFENTKRMAGYCIELYKYMRIDENFSKKKKLMEARKNVIDNVGEESKHEKFLAYGEFDRIGFEKVTRLSKFRDVAENSKIWIGDRQTLLAYEISEKKCKDAVFYHEGDFYVREEEGMVRSEQLFLGITILQFKDTQKSNQDHMSDYLYHCKENIIQLVKTEKPDIRCSVLGTLGTFGLIILWLADQYSDVLHMVTKIRNTDIGNENARINKSIFMSAYTIFAQNHPCSTEWDNKIKEIRGDALLRLTLKRGISEEILTSLREWKINGTEIYHSAGEHDIVIRMKSAYAFNLFSNGSELNNEMSFIKDNVLQSNLQLCEDIQNSNVSEFFMHTEDSTIKNLDEKKEEWEKTLPELEGIQTEYKELRGLFKTCFPSTAGMVDTLDWLYSDYISKISTASNEMWASNFSYQFLMILQCLTKFVKNLNGMKMYRQEALQIINDLLSDFERQISHIAESNNLILGTPICQFRYSGQNNLTLYSYFGIIKSVLASVYEKQEVSSQAEIVPLIVADIVPIIKSNLFIDYNNKNDARVITINLPMIALYDPVCYYPYLLHEIFHYVVPKDRCVRNEIWGCLISAEMMNAVCEEILIHKLCFKENSKKKQLNILLKDFILPSSYSFIVDYHGKYMRTLHDDNETYHDIDEKTLTVDRYEQEILNKWYAWIEAEHNIELSNNPIFLFLGQLYSEKDDFIKKLKEWGDDRLKAGENFQDTIGEVIDFLEKLGGIADNSVLDTRDQNFVNLMSCIGDEVFENTMTLMDSIKEALVDISMVTIGGMDVAEYLLLFTKIKKELLLDDEGLRIDIQDIIRIGMVLDFIWKEKDGDSFIGLFDSSRAAFMDMYCGLYYCMHKLDADMEFRDKICKEAEAWFEYWRTCFQNYILRYRIHAVFFRELQSQLLEVADENNNLKYIPASMCWKKYTEELRDYGNYIRSNDIVKSQEQWKEKRSVVDNRVFNLNIELINSYQYQESFSELNKKRQERIGTVKANLYAKQDYSYEKFKAPEILLLPGRLCKRRYYSWKYEISDVGQLGDLTALIAKELKEANNRLLGKNEYPIWYRGQQSVKYILVPSIMRKYKSQKTKQKEKEVFSLVSFIRREFEEFRFRADGSQEVLERVGYTEADYIALMQHYSVASNFLDWTEDALSALYFALEGFLDEKAEKPDEDAALYVFSPALYNHVRKRMILEANKDKRKLGLEKDVLKTVQDGIPNLTVSFNDKKYDMYLLGKEEYGDDNSTPYTNLLERDKKLPFYMPVAIYISRLNKRIQIQNGIFLAYNIYTSPDTKDEFDYVSLERIQEYYFNMFADNNDEEVCPFLYKIAIKKEEREKIAAWVSAFGMSKEKCYPELNYIGERIMK